MCDVNTMHMKLQSDYIHYTPISDITSTFNKYDSSQPQFSLFDFIPSSSDIILTNQNWKYIKGDVLFAAKKIIAIIANTKPNAGKGCDRLNVR